jgi:hypothetical protein
MQYLFEINSTDASTVTVVDDNCAMVPRAEAYSAIFQMSLDSSSSSLPGLSRWDSQPIRPQTEEKHPNRSRCPSCPRRMPSFQDESDSDEERHLLQTSPPRQPTRRGSMGECTATASLEEDAFKPGRNFCFDTPKNQSMDAASTNLLSALTGTFHRSHQTGHLHTELDKFDLTATKIQTDRFLRSNLRMMDIPSPYMQRSDATTKNYKSFEGPDKSVANKAA